MKLIEALQILQKAPPTSAEPMNAFLACGFTSLHLQTFLAAQLQLRYSGRKVKVEGGLFGDLIGDLDRLTNTPLDVGVVVIEWSDLDPRLGIRSLGGWGLKHLTDILDTVGCQVTRIQDSVVKAAQHVPLVVCLPTLPLPPLSHTPGYISSGFEAQLQNYLSGLAVHLATTPRVRLLHSQRLDLVSALGGRLDVKSDLHSGFPYTVTHASCLADLLSELIQPAAPKKGLIVDLDDTLWQGELGEVGVYGVTWDLEHHTHIQWLYQQFLSSLAEACVLIAVASKNDPALVDEAVQREDMVLRKECVFPFEIHWGPKSDSVKRILQAWNVGADSVVFVDDSLMELAAVQAAFPEVDCKQFPQGDPQGVYNVLESLRDFFGKERVSEEDAIRLQSIRGANSFEEGPEFKTVTPDRFLEQVMAEIGLNFTKDPVDSEH